MQSLVWNIHALRTALCATHDPTELAVNAPRRFDEREIALIFEQANAAQESRVTVAEQSNGLTLEQLHDIGRDVGLSPEHITRAANAVARGDLVPTARRTWLGLPVGVSRTIEFNRPVSDAEWNQLVMTLRETFDARGKLTNEGPFRQWHNGNLQALLEPTPTGHRLRLTTKKGDAPVRLLMGAMYLFLAALFAGLVSVGAVGDKANIGVLLFSIVGVGALASAYIGLPRWAKVRASQMEAIAAHSAELNTGR
jgi:hypothetical protein